MNFYKLIKSNFCEFKRCFQNDTILLRVENHFLDIQWNSFIGFKEISFQGLK